MGDWIGGQLITYKTVNILTRIVHSSQNGPFKKVKTNKQTNHSAWLVKGQLN